MPCARRLPSSSRQFGADGVSQEEVAHHVCRDVRFISGRDGRQRGERLHAPHDGQFRRLRRPSRGWPPVIVLPKCSWSPWPGGGVPWWGESVSTSRRLCCSRSVLSWQGRPRRSRKCCAIGSSRASAGEFGAALPGHSARDLSPGGAGHGHGHLRHGCVLAPAMGPILGGWLTDHYGWPWVFILTFRSASWAW